MQIDGYAKPQRFWLLGSGLECGEPSGRPSLDEAMVNRKLWIGCGLWLFFGCGTTSQVERRKGFQAEALQGRAILFLPVAVSDELGDARTGIVLSLKAIRESAAQTCEALREDVSDPTIRCYYDESVRDARPLIQELVQRFAHDAPVSRELLAALANASSCHHVLLFRPEGVDAQTDTLHARKPKYEWTEAPPYDGPPVLANPLANSAAIAAASAGGEVIGNLLGQALADAIAPGPRKVKSRSYTLSAQLIEMQEGRIDAAAVHTESGSRSDGEYPSAALLLGNAMAQLADDLLD